MMHILRAQRGFTLMEVVMVTAILGMLSIAVLASFKGLGSNQALNKNASLVSSVLAQARSLTLASKDDARYGVHFEASRIVLFKGSSYSPSDPSNVVSELDSQVTISSIDLSGAAVDVIFERLSGKAQASGAITLTLLSDPSSSKVIIIHRSGLSEEN